MLYMDAAGMDADMLVVYIIGSHHDFERHTIRRMLPMIRRLAESHESHPELFEVARRLETLSARLLDQMTAEERVLFPYVTDAATAYRCGHRLPRSPYASIEAPLTRMHEEHEWARRTMAKVRALTCDYRVSPGACEAWVECMRALEAFDRDLQAHADLERNILGPKLRMLAAPCAFA